ncbi:endonuclease domain-containing protein [Streptomyces hydrogenans]|uniref:endonuclease domain-containing protein n=1 Tax=Streptomyces hydrogenans TaxID=1873719 RepID=UPI003419D149
MPHDFIVTRCTGHSLTWLCGRRTVKTGLPCRTPLLRCRRHRTDKEIARFRRETFPPPRAHRGPRFAPDEYAAFYERMWRTGEEDVQPACWRWERPTPSLRSAFHGPSRLEEITLFLAFHDERCAVCGKRRPLVEDHDHHTRLVRGLLCNSCNGTEGHRRDSGHDRWARYRHMPPARILDINRKYPWLRGIR